MYYTVVDFWGANFVFSQWFQRTVLQHLQERLLVKTIKMKHEGVRFLLNIRMLTNTRQVLSHRLISTRHLHTLEANTSITTDLTALITGTSFGPIGMADL